MSTYTALLRLFLSIKNKQTKNSILLARYLSQLSSYLQEVVNLKFTFDINHPYTFQYILMPLSYIMLM